MQVGGGSASEEGVLSERSEKEAPWTDCSLHSSASILALESAQPNSDPAAAAAGILTS